VDNGNAGAGRSAYRSADGLRRSLHDAPVIGRFSRIFNQVR